MIAVEARVRNPRDLDQFFTHPLIAERCVQFARRFAEARLENPLWVEPSAGQGAFLNLLPSRRIGLDLSPGAREIIEADFLRWRPGSVDSGVVVVGNPPFGKNSSLAIRFFNHAADFADVIAMIVPRTFQKASTHAKLDARFHLADQHPIDPFAFVFDGEPYDVPTVFQIWEKRQANRTRFEVARRHPHFEFVSAERGEFAFQRVGARAGLVSEEGLRKSAQSHYFLKPKIRWIDIRAVLRGIDWAPIKSCTAGNPSIGKAELIEQYVRAIA